MTAHFVDLVQALH